MCHTKRPRFLPRTTRPLYVDLLALKFLLPAKQPTMGFFLIHAFLLRFPILQPRLPAHERHVYPVFLPCPNPMFLPFWMISLLMISHMLSFPDSLISTKHMISFPSSFCLTAISPLISSFLMLRLVLLNPIAATMMNHLGEKPCLPWNGNT